MNLSEINILHVICAVIVSWISWARIMEESPWILPIWPPVQSTFRGVSKGPALSWITYTFNLHSLSILDCSCKRNVWVPSVMQLWLFLCWNIQWDFTNVTDPGEAHDEDGRLRRGNLEVRSTRVIEWD
jgi:hypothetical protein